MFGEKFKNAYINTVPMPADLTKVTVVKSLKDYLRVFGDIRKIRYSKRRGYKGKDKNGKNKYFKYKNNRLVK